MTQPHQIDLDAYFERIGDDGPRDVSLENLNRMIAAHVQSIPFESLDVLLRRGISIDLADIEAKLVGARRGGYCFEQNTLMLQVLRQLGYTAQPISARVTYRKPTDVLPARTHIFCRVTLEGRDWFVDVGVGAATPTCALRVELDSVQSTPHEPRRFVTRGDWDGLDRRSPDAVMVHQVEHGGEWFDVCEFTLEEMHPIDRELGNWYTSAHPDSYFGKAIMAARATENGRVTISNQGFTRRANDGTKTSRTMANDAEILEVLASEFGIVLRPLEGEPGTVRLLDRIER